MRFLLPLVLVLMTPFSLFAQAEDYPGRAVYRSVSIYETEQLNNQFDQVSVVDVRSNYEYDTLHVNNAINIPLNSRKFKQELTKVQAKGKPIIFYCNGHTCYKSYKAVLKAKKAGFTNIFSYDSGIFDWAKAHPEKSTMLGISPIDPDKLISKSKLKEHLLEPTLFTAKIKDSTQILDIREPAQRGLMELFPYRQENISLVEKDQLVKYLSKVLETGNTLLVYDEAGKQVRWLQYYLEAKGIKKYYFMTGGVKQYFKDARNSNKS